MTCIQIPDGTDCVQPTYKAGDPPPPPQDGYLKWHEWAKTQYRAGLRQKMCGCCGKWKYPQELHTKALCHVCAAEAAKQS